MLPQFSPELRHCLNLLLFHPVHNEILDVICLNTNLVETKTKINFDINNKMKKSKRGMNKMEYHRIYMKNCILPFSAFQVRAYLHIWERDTCA